MAETTGTKPLVQQQFEARSAQNQAGITGAYDSGLAAQKQSLLDAYNANAAAQQGAAETVRRTGGMAGNDIAVQNARNMGGINQFADARGVNRQQGSQAALQLGNARNAAMANMAYQQQTALAENQRQQDLAKMQYQAQVQAAIADKDYKQAAALLDNYNNENKWRDQQAALLASYGNFDPYRNMYGDGAADAMRNVWLRQNPDTAYKLGEMTPDTYRSITGKWPEGYNPGGGGYGWYGGGVGSRPKDEGKPGALLDDLPTREGLGKQITPLYTYNNGRTVTRATTNIPKNSGITINNTAGKIKE